MTLTTGQDKAQGIAQSVNHEMDFAAEPTATVS
jgi:hypothetical protein